MNAPPDDDQDEARDEAGAAPSGRRLVPGAPPALAAVSSAQIIEELARRQRRIVGLHEQRDALRRELAEIDLTLARIADTPLSTGVATAASPVRPHRPEPGAPRPPADDGRRRRVRNEQSLPDALAAAVDPGASVSPSDAARLVRKRGYLSNARNFPMMVSHALSGDPRFRRLSRGTYLRLPDEAAGR